MKKLLTFLTAVFLALGVQGAVLYPGTGSSDGSAISYPTTTNITYITNFYFYSTNLYAGDTNVAFYYTTNVFNDTYVSNFFQTNYLATNVYQTNITATNVFVTDNYVSNFFMTNILQDTYNSNYYVTQVFTNVDIITTNVTIVTNVYVDYFYTSNLFTTNTTVNNLYALTGRVASLTITNGLSFLEHLWGGPTNQLTLSTNEYYYVAYTPCAVTNLASWQGAGYAESGLLSITNASDSNITFTVYSPIRIPYGETSRSYTITNGDVWFGSFRKGAHGMAYVPRGFL